MKWPFHRPSCVVRPLRAGDAAACARLHDTSFGHPWSAAEFEQLLSSRAVSGAAAVDGAALRGFVLARSAAGEAEILTIVVAPDQRRRGLAYGLMQQQLGSLMALGVREVFLEVDEKNAPAIALYERLGFVKVGTRKAYYRTSDGPANALVLRKVL